MLKGTTESVGGRSLERRQEASERGGMDGQNGRRNEPPGPRFRYGRLLAASVAVSQAPDTARAGSSP